MAGVGGLEEGEPPVPGRHRAGRSGARRPWLVALAALVVVGSAAGAGVHALYGGHTDPHAVAVAAPTTSASPVATPDLHPRPAVDLAPSSTAGSPSSPVASATASSTTPPSATPTSDALRTKAIQDVLGRHAAALLSRNRSAFDATLDPAATAFRTAQLAVFADTASVPFASWYYEVDPADVAAATVPRAGQLLVAVTLRYALRGFDPQPTALREYFTFLTSATSSWLMASDTDGAANGEASARDLWDFGPVVAVKGVSSLVLSHPANAAFAQVLATTADAAVPRVTAFWGDSWARRVVILVPSTEDELREIVGTTQDLSQIAALATAEISSSARGDSAVGDRIAINPPTFDMLGALGRRVVMTHEITHVATRSVTATSSPTWLVEGIADYVGFKGTGTSLRFDAAELAHQVDLGHLPTALPIGADFTRDSGNGDALAEDYEEAWLACKFIVSRTNEATLIAFYRQVGTASGSPAEVLANAFAQVLHTDQATFTASWRSYVAVSLK